MNILQEYRAKAVVEYGEDVVQQASEKAISFFETLETESDDVCLVAANMVLLTTIVALQIKEETK